MERISFTFADRLELRLDRPQQQPLGIFGADAALGELDVDDRDPDVGLGLLGDGDIGDEPRAQQKDERRDGESRVIDGVVDKGRTCHAASYVLDEEEHTRSS